MKNILRRYIYIAMAICLMVNGLFLPTQQVLAAPSEWNPGNLTSIQSYGTSNCAIADGKVYCWGAELAGQLGNGSDGFDVNGQASGTQPSPVPVDASGVLAGKMVTKLAKDISCAIADGKVYCWGYENSYGQFGNGTTGQSTTPVAVDASGVLAGKTVTDIKSNRETVCVLASGEIFCWGSGLGGGLGNGTTQDSLIPVAVDTSGALAGKTITSFAVGGGGNAGGATVCVLASGGLYCWGSDGFGMLGNGTGGSSSVPIAVNSGALAGKTITSFAVNNTNTCAIADGDAYCWGYKGFGGIGDGKASNGESPSPVDATGVLAGKTVTEIANTDSNMCVIADNKPYCWGQYIYGDSADVPVAMDINNVLTGDSVTTISAQRYGSRYCILSAGSAYCWGGGLGALGDGESNSYNLNKVGNNSGMAGKVVTDISTSGSSTCAIAADRVYCWGMNDYGQVGNNSTFGIGSTESELLPLIVQDSPEPEVTSLSESSVTIGVDSLNIVINGAGFDSKTKVTIGGQEAYIYSMQSTALGVQVPASSIAGSVDVVVTNNNGKSTVVENGFTYTPVPDKIINSAAFSSVSGKKLLSVSGTGLVGQVNPAEYGEAVQRSLVTLNGVELPFCAEGSGASASLYIEALGMSPDLVSDFPICYQLFDGEIGAPLITPTSATILLLDDFDITAQGTVSVNGSNTFTFNQQTTPGNEVADPTVIVGNKSLETKPTINKRPTFSGTAEPGAVVTVTVRSDPITCTTTADSNGNWSCTLPSDLPPGDHTVNVRIANPDNSIDELGPYAVVVTGSGAGIVTPATPLAPNTGEGRLLGLQNNHISYGVVGLSIVFALIAPVTYIKQSQSAKRLRRTSLRL